MSAVKGTGNKSTERRLQMAMVRSGLTDWRIRPSGIIGNPDFLFPERKLAVFVDGCFWHGCPKCGHLPKTNAKFWEEKILRNKKRDRANSRKLRAGGFAVLRLWEHELKDKIDDCIDRLSCLLH